MAEHIEAAYNNPATKLPLDPSLYSLQPEELAFLQSQTHIEDQEELKNHIIDVQTRAYEISGFPCIRRFSFTKMKIFHLPAYPKLLELGKQRDGAIFLDLGCCFGNDIRKAVSDGFPVQNVIASDLQQEFWALGHELYRSTPETFPATFIAGDVFDPTFIEARKPFYEVPLSSPPPLNSIISLTGLQGHVSAIHTSSFFHLFDEAGQLQVAKRVASLLSPIPGSIIFGIHKGAPEKGIRPPKLGRRMFCHSPESWRELWGQVFEEGAFVVDAGLRERPELAMDGDLLWWTVTRV